tara:strand:+ start:630 stop:1211 length:582 start_codon:yes stop_codon:yes gene_type:complete
MRFIVFLFFIFSSTYSQNEAFVYLDLSKINRLVEVADQVNSIMNKHSDVILYISNKNSPEIWKKSDFSKRKFLEFLEGSGGFYSPDLSEMTDIQNINNYFSENGTLNGLDDFFNNTRYNFYFIFNGKHLTRTSLSRSLNERIIKPLLLSNKLLQRNNRSIKNCKVTILYDDPSNQFKNNIKSKTPQNYEIKSF